MIREDGSIQSSRHAEESFLSIAEKAGSQLPANIDRLTPSDGLYNNRLG